MNTKLFSIDAKDVSKALVMAVLSGALLPVLAAVQTPGFDISQVQWSGILNLAINGAVLGFVSYITKNFFSDEQGRVMGRIG